MITFCVSRRRRKMYCGHARLRVYLSAAIRPHYCTDPDVTWGHGRGCPLVVHYWADLQFGHGLHCYGNITRTLVNKLASIPRYDDIVRTAGWAGSVRAAGGWRGAFSKLRAVYGKWVWLARRWLAVDGGRSQHYCGGLDCGLPLMAFWQQKSERKMYSLYAWF